MQFFPDDIGDADHMPESLLQGYMRNTSLALQAIEVRVTTVGIHARQRGQTGEQSTQQLSCVHRRL